MYPAGYKRIIQETLPLIMKRLLSIIVLLPCLAFSQPFQIKGVIKDKNTNKIIPYVNIGIFEKSVGTVSNEKGEFEILIDEEYMESILSFSHINYEFHQVQIKDLINDSNICLLTQKTNQLEEVIVSGTKPYLIGRKNSKNSVKGYFKAKGLGGEGGTLIRNTENCKVKSFSLNVLKNSFESLTFRLNFYNVKSNKPAKKIGSNTIFIINQGQTGILTIDLNDADLKINSDFVVSIELIKLDKGEIDNPEFLFSAYQDRSSVIFRRLISMDKWEKFKKYGLCFWIEIEK